MEFNPNVLPVFPTLSETLVARMRAVFYERRTIGLNVQCQNDEGVIAEHSFHDIAARNEFVTVCIRKNRDYAISA